MVRVKLTLTKMSKVSKRKSAFWAFIKSGIIFTPESICKDKLVKMAERTF